MLHNQQTSPQKYDPDFEKQGQRLKIQGQRFVH